MPRIQRFRKHVNSLIVWNSLTIRMVIKKRNCLLMIQLRRYLRRWQTIRPKLLQ